MSIRKHSLINLAGAVLPLALMLVTVPLYLDVLGKERYGVLALVWLVLGYFSMMEMGLGKATANQIAQARERSKKVRSEIFWTALLANITLGVIAAVILWLMGETILTKYIKMSEIFRHEVMQTVPWLVITLPLALVSSVLVGALEGREEFLVVNALQVAGNIVFQTIPLAFAYFVSPALDVVIPVAVLSKAAMSFPFLIVCYYKVPITIAPALSFERLKRLFSFGGWVAITGVAAPIMETIDRFIIGGLLGAKAVAVYTVAYQLVSRVRILPASLLRTLFPRFSASTGMAADVARKALEEMAVIMTLVVTLAELLIETLLNVWIGEELGGEVAPLARILFVGVLVNALAYIPLGFLQGRGAPDIVAKVQLIELIPFLIVIYFSVGQWGIIGAAVAWSCRAAVDALLLYRISDINVSLLNAVIVPGVFVLAAYIIATFASEEFFIIGLVALVGCLYVWARPALEGYISMLQLHGRRAFGRTNE